MSLFFALAFWPSGFCILLSSYSIPSSYHGPPFSFYQMPQMDAMASNDSLYCHDVNDTKMVCGLLKKWLYDLFLFMSMCMAMCMPPEV